MMMNFVAGAAVGAVVSLWLTRLVQKKLSDDVGRVRSG